MRAEGRAGLVIYLTAGDPDAETSLALLQGLAGAGADLIEIGMPFTDPMADGPAIQAAGQRALKAGMTLAQDARDGAHACASAIRDTPIVLMGYYNPIYRYGAEAFARDAAAAGVDGAIVVDLPPEEAEELAVPARAAGLDIIRLATPTSDDSRLPAIVAACQRLSSITSRSPASPAPARPTPPMCAPRSRGCAGSPDLPVAVGFGIKNAGAGRRGGAGRRRRGGRLGLVDRLARNLDADGRAKPELVEAVLADIRALAARGARRATRA